MKSLQEQLKNDHAEFVLLREKLQNGTINTYERGQLIRVACWITKELTVIRKLRDRDLEETIYGEGVFLESQF